MVTRRFSMLQGAAQFVADHPFDFLTVIAAGWAVAFFAWTHGHPALTGSLVLQNELAPAGRRVLLGWLAAGSMGSLAVWAIAALALKDRVTTVSRLVLVAYPLTLLAVIPILALPGVEENRPYLVLVLVPIAATITFAGAQRAVDLGIRLPAACIGRRRGFAAVILLTLAYVGFMSVLTLARHKAFLTHSYDLGIHDQAMYALLRHGYMITTQMGPEPLNFIADHFSPIFYLVAPIYALWQDARSLLILQSVALAAGAIPLYLLAWERTQHASLALALAAGYLLHPALAGVNTFDFHQIALVPPLLLWSLYFLEIKAIRRFLFFLFLALITKEEVALTVAAFGVYLFLAQRRYALGAALTTFGVAYFAVVVGYVMPALGGSPYVNRFSGLMPQGQEGLAGVMLTLVTNPFYLVAYVLTNPAKLLFLAQLFVPVLLLPFLAGRAWILGIPALAVTVLASADVMYSLGVHYPAIMLPFVFYLTLIGSTRIDVRRISRGALATALVVSALGMNWQYGWLFGKQFTGLPQQSAHQRVVASFLDDVPQAAKVVTLSDIVPHLSAREHIYLFPWVGDAEYILFDAGQGANYWPLVSRDPRGEAAATLLPYLANDEFGLMREEDGVLLLRRGHDPASNERAIAVLYSGTFQAEALPSDFSESLVTDAAAGDRAARRATPEAVRETGKDALTFGPYSSLAPGRYQVVFRLKADAVDGSDPVATLEVFSTAYGGPLAARDLAIGDFHATGEYEDFSLRLEVPKLLDDVEYRVRYRGAGRLWADAITVTYEVE